MPRASQLRLEELGIVVCCAVLSSSSLGSLLFSTPSRDVQQKYTNAEQLLTELGQTLYTGLSHFIPGIFVAFTAYYASCNVHWERPSRSALRGGALFAGVCCGAGLLWVILMRSPTVAPESAPVPTGRHQFSYNQQHVTTRSGEWICTDDGQCVMRRHPDLGWVMSDALRQGKDQMVIVFSRPDCPWCEKLVPVIQKALRGRSEDVAAADTVAQDADSMLKSPLRVFVIDAGELGNLTERFGVSAFPTIMFFGRSGQEPLVAEGYLDEKGFSEFVRTAGESSSELPAKQIYHDMDLPFR
eukprot:TRINITY_DN62472_c0_g1_i1.p1 TRINITY_DN62472_c0_g1~~TRINITY_DN62472_c0_g1_i1.p1  ORF type:complete len:299 (-),score=29.87 TRINITY_DN62472_c0_g1_i1:148-1044(-)